MGAGGGGGGWWWEMKRILCSDWLPVRVHDGPIMLARDRPLCPFIEQACSVKIASGCWQS